jgi:hypothetical protein
VDFETRLKRAQFELSVMERALNDPGPWAIGWGGTLCDATVTSDSDGVIFSATFTEGEDNHFELYLRGELVYIFRGTLDVMSLREGDRVIAKIKLAMPALV